MRTEWRFGWVVVCVLAFSAGCGDKAASTGVDPGQTDDVVASGEIADDAVTDEEVPPICTPACDGKACGDDGCGGSCGTCADGTCVAGACCVAGCDGKACGDDGCGGSCGTCAAGTCVAGACCVPACDGKACGDDGCGGTCGACGDGQECRTGACRAPCTRVGFEEGTKFVQSSWKPIEGDDDPRGKFFYMETTSEDFPLEALRLDIRQWEPFDGPVAPGTYAIDTDKYGKCNVCLQMFQNCTNEGCEKKYLGTKGTIEITQMDGAKGPFQAVLKDVTFSEAKIDVEWNTYLVPSGATWCLDEHPLSAGKVELAKPEPTCVEAGTGVLQDKNIADFTLTNCLGREVKLHGKCGQVKAMRLLLVTGWCSFCAEAVPLAAELAEEMKSDLGLWVVMGEDGAGETVDLDECKAYAESHGADPNLVFIDNGWEKTMTNIYPYGFAGIPYDILLDGDNMAYIWATGMKGDLGTFIEWLIAN